MLLHTPFTLYLLEIRHLDGALDQECTSGVSQSEYLTLEAPDWDGLMRPYYLRPFQIDMLTISLDLEEQ